MRRRGQITLEIVVLLFVTINIFLYVSMPLAKVGRTAVGELGLAALTAKTVDSMAGKANLVGISGEGSKDYLELEARGELNSVSCSGGAITAAFELHNVTDVDEPRANESLGIGVTPLIGDPLSRTYSKQTDFDLDCSGMSNLSDSDSTVCAQFENAGPSVSINVSEGGCP